MLSVIIITKNESQHIDRCLASVAWADEIIVFDSGSTDITVEICKRYTPWVFVTDWPGFGPQKQRALDKASGDWILSIDADEYISDALKAEIQNVISKNAANGYEIPRLSSYCGKQIKHGGWWPDYVLRLFRHKDGRFTDDIVHERITVNGKTQQLTNPILHEAFVDSEEVLRKINTYSSLGAKKLFAQGKKTSLTQALYKSIWTFFRTYILQAAFMNGPHGLMLAISNAEGTYYKYVKLLDLCRKQAQK
jgi:glycosyltransferase involved in cell wall biosynthesis